MATPASRHTLSRHTLMTLYADASCPESHCVRLVLAEKEIEVNIRYVAAQAKPAVLLEINPYNEILTLIDRDVILYTPEVILEYLDERFPHPPLMPLEPVARANNRLCRYRIKRDLYRQLSILLSAGEKKAATAKRQIRSALENLAPAFEHKSFFMSDHYSLIDCYIAPFLWRLPSAGLPFSKQPQALIHYAERVFARTAFQLSLSQAEQEMADA